MDIGSIKNTVIQGDCLEVMKQLPDKCIDLVLTDPPYGIGIDKKFKQSANKKGGLAYKSDFGESDRDGDIPSSEYFEQIMRISKNQIIWGGNYFVESLYNSPHWIVWNKNINGNFADCELARTNYDKPIKKYDFTRNGMIQDDMASKETRYHPTQKPVGLFRKLIFDYTEPGMTILDCFAGSGTTGIVCKELSRNYILIEKEPKYIEIINKRLENITPSLF